MFSWSLALMALMGCASCGQSVEGELHAGSSPKMLQTGTRPRAVAIADLNGDGRLDIAVANAESDDVSVFLARDGQGMAFDTLRFPAGNEPADVNIVDIDGDGASDLVFANHETSYVTVLINDGAGAFSPMPGSPFATGASPHVHGLATSDFDANGWMDIAVDSSGTNSISVLFAGPDGFSAPRQFPAGAFVYYRIDAADWNGDGIDDVVTPNPRQNRLSFLAWDGTAMTITSQIPTGPASMAIAVNYDGDASPDIAALWNGTLGLWHRRSGTFEVVDGFPMSIESATEVAAGDVDGDGLDEIVVGPWEGSAITIVNPRSGEREELEACDRPIGIAIGDLDEDGLSEIVVACSLDDRIEIHKRR